MGARVRERSSRLSVALLIALAMLVGCGHGEPRLPPVSPVILAAVVEAIRKKRAWVFESKSDNRSPARRKDRHRGFFVYRRAASIGSHRQDWIDEPGQPRLIARIEAEIDALEGYLARRLGTRRAPGPLGGGTDPVAPAHLDLADVARPQTTTKQAVIDANVAEYRRLRRTRAQTIIYRAAAIHSEPWTPATEPPALREAALDEVVDRRLRAVERMSFQIGNPATLGRSGGRKWRGLVDADGPWLDGFRIRMIEYSRLSPPALFVDVVGAGTIAEPAGPTAGKTWQWSQTRRRLEYIGTASGAYFPPAIRADIENTGSYTIPVKPAAGRTAAAVIEDLFTPSTDFWARTWFWCDHAMSAVNIEALRFALRRRNGNDDEFNKIVTDHDSGYVAFSAFITSSANYLQAANDDQYFENIKQLDIADLEIGDQLIFWNSFVYGRISGGDWRLENAYVMEIDSQPDGGTILLPQLELQGHGTSQKTYQDYQNNEILPHLREGLHDAREAIDTALAADPTVTAVPWKGKTDRLVKWSPYEDSPGIGAWWIRIGINEPPYERWNSVAEAKAAMPKTISDLDPAQRGPGYHPPPALDSVYFPLVEPRSGWDAYLQKRAANASVAAPSLVVTRLTGDILPGLFRRGASQPIPVIKPEIR